MAGEVRASWEGPCWLGGSPPLSSTASTQSRTKRGTVVLSRWHRASRRHPNTWSGRVQHWGKLGQGALGGEANWDHGGGVQGAGGNVGDWEGGGEGREGHQDWERTLGPGMLDWKGTLGLMGAQGLRGAFWDWGWWGEDTHKDQEGMAGLGRGTETSGCNTGQGGALGPTGDRQPRLSGALGHPPPPLPLWGQREDVGGFGEVLRTWWDLG